MKLRLSGQLCVSDSDPPTQASSTVGTSDAYLYCVTPKREEEFFEGLARLYTSMAGIHSVIRVAAAAGDWSL